MSTTISELKNLALMMTESKQLECDIGFENIKHEYFQVEIYDIPEKYHSVEFNMNINGDFYFRSKSGGIHITDIPTERITLSLWSLGKITEYFDKNNIPVPDIIKTAIKYKRDDMGYPLYYFITELIPMITYNKNKGE